MTRHLHLDRRTLVVRLGACDLCAIPADDSVDILTDDQVVSFKIADKKDAVRGS